MSYKAGNENKKKISDFYRNEKKMIVFPKNFKVF